MAVETVEALMEARKTTLETTLLSQLALTPIPWLSSIGDDHLTLSDSVSPDDSTMCL